MSNFAILYLSKPTHVINSESLLQIEEISKKNNAQVGVQGYLYFNGKYFLQYLEGPESEVKEVYDRIEKDERHDIKVYSSRIIEKPKFENWSMRLLIKGNDGEVSLDELIIKIVSQMAYYTENSKLETEQDDKMWQMIDRVAEYKMDYV